MDDIVNSEEVWNAIYLATKRNRLDLLNWLIQKQVPVDTRGDAWFTPLHLACQEGFTDIAIRLIEVVPSLIYMKSKEGNLPIHLAVSKGHLDTVKALISHESPLYERSLDGFSVVHLSVMHLDMLRLLIEDYEMPPDIWMTQGPQWPRPLHSAIQRGAPQEVVEYLFRRLGEPLDTLKYRHPLGNHTLMINSVQNGQLDTLTWLYDKVPDQLAQSNDHKETPLCVWQFEEGMNI